MKNTFLLSAAIALIVLVISIRVMFYQNIKQFRVDLKQHENLLQDNFTKKKSLLLDSIKSNNKLFNLFNANYSESIALTSKDTVFRYFYLTEDVKYNRPTPSYLNCLVTKCQSDLNNDSLTKVFNSQAAILKKKYDKAFSKWYINIGRDRLFKKKDIDIDCKDLFPDIFTYYYDSAAWKEFEDFLLVYKTDFNKINNENKVVEDLYSSKVSSNRNKVNGDLKDYYDLNVSNNRGRILVTKKINKTFESKSIGIINYDLEKLTFNNKEFNKVINETLKEQWKHHSLNTGAMPYSKAYGSNNYCDESACSKISVRAGGEDVLVTIKNRRGKVVRHGYIKANGSFDFNLPDGEYQVFFYSGTGWSPDKIIATSTKRELHGGFVENEHFSKDDFITLYSQVMTYKLILQENGNLITQPSSDYEAF